MAVELRRQQPCRRSQGRSRVRLATSSLFLAAAVLGFPRAAHLRGQAEWPVPGTAALFSGRRSKVLCSYRDYQVVYRPRGKGKFLPRLQLRKIPPNPVSLDALGGSVEGNADRDILGFPFTTQNVAALQLGFPRWAGQLSLSTEEAVTQADDENVQRVGEAAYEQRTPGLGNVTGKLRTTGEWSVGFERQVEDLGTLSGGLNSQLDWSVDLDSAYPPVWGFVPRATYGATQDGMRLRTQFEGPLHKNVHASYTVQNQAGRYSPSDFTHDAKLVLASGRKRHVLEALGTFDRKLDGFPARGSLAYRASLRPVTFEASVDASRYRLQAEAANAKVAAAVGRKTEENGRPAELQLQVGKVSATALTDGQKPRVRLDVAL